MPAVPKPQLIKIIDLTINKIRQSKYNSGICTTLYNSVMESLPNWIQRDRLDLYRTLLLHLDKYKPVIRVFKVFWFPLTLQGGQQRINILNNVKRDIRTKVLVID